MYIVCRSVSIDFISIEHRPATARVVPATPLALCSTYIQLPLYSNNYRMRALKFRKNKQKKSSNIISTFLKNYVFMYIHHVLHYSLKVKKKVRGILSRTNFSKKLKYTEPYTYIPYTL